MLSDTQLGLLTGTVFAMFYVTLGIPIARFADQSNRKNIIAICLTLWSGLTALTGMATNFVQLVLARIGVGIGEAGCSPQSHAIISDYYPLEKRATALSIYSLGINIGLFIGGFGGGFINQYYGWRTAFIAMGIPGILLAIVLYFTVKEPVRGASDAFQRPTETQSLEQVLQYLYSKRSFVYLALGTGFTAFVLYGVGNWMASFFSRYHGVSPQSVGIINALMYGIGGGIGTFAGGYLGDRLGKVAKKWYMWIPMIGVLGSIPLSLIAIFTPHIEVAVAFFFLSFVFSYAYLGPSIAVAHSLVPAQMRAATSSVLFFVLNFIGLGIGPIIVGMLSDALVPSMGADSLRYALISTVIAGLIGGLCYLIAGKTLDKDLKVKTAD